MTETTPVRRLGALNSDGCRVLSDPGLTYADGAEGRLAEIVAGATDISSSSEELAAAATDWGTTYSLIGTRSNIVRALDLKPEMKVLEIGCGCGPITRYLGEQCGSVDSVEPMPARAKVARLRTRDLDSVEIFVGMLDDVPAVPTYDVVVVIGVLEYVGNGTADHAPYLRFLEQCHAVLKEGGTLALAIENPLGVKYIAGAVEDHTNRPFDSLEDYVLASPARTFTRRTLDGMLAAVGFESQFLAAFPDYKLPRALMADGLFRSSDALAQNLPRFPSPDYLVPRLNLADEALTWRTLVASGVGEHFGNSFYALAAKGTGPALWPADRLGLLFSTERRREFAVRAEVLDVDGALTFERARMHPVETTEHPDVRHEPAMRETVSSGTEMVRWVLENPDRRAAALREWEASVPGDGTEWMPVDLVPHNILVDADGSPTAIDQEWFVRGFSRDSVILRGLVMTTQLMARLTRQESLAPWITVADGVRALAAEIDFEVTDARRDVFFAEEAAFLGVVMPVTHETEPARDRAARDLRIIWDESLDQVRGGQRFDFQWATASAMLGGHHEELSRMRGEIGGLQGQVAAMQSDLARERQRAIRAEEEREHLMHTTLYGAALRVRRRLRRARAERAAGRTDQG